MRERVTGFMLCAVRDMGEREGYWVHVVCCEVTSCFTFYCSHWVGVAQLAAAGGDRRKSLLIILSLRDAGLLQANQKWGMCLSPHSLVWHVMCLMQATS